MSTQEATEKPVKKKHRVRKVLLIILAVLAVLIMVTFTSCKVMSIPSEPVVSNIDDAAEITAAAADEGKPIEALEALNIPKDQLYQSLNGKGWAQTGDVYDEIDDSTWYVNSQPKEFVGTDSHELMGACYDMCHKEGALAYWSAPYDEARAAIQRMSDDYNCNLTDEQVESLTALFVE